MQIPELSPLLLISVCGLSVVCVGFMGVLAFVVIRFTGGELFEWAGGLTELFSGGGDDNQRAEDSPVRGPQRADLRSRAQSFDFDEAVSRSGSGEWPENFGANSKLSPGGDQDNPKYQDLNARPSGRLYNSKNNVPLSGDQLQPRHRPSEEYLPDEGSNIGGRVGRHNTGRGQTGQRLDANLGDDLDGGLGHRRPRTRGEDRRTSRNRGGDRTRDDERFGGMYDYDGDGDLDT